MAIFLWEADIKMVQVKRVGENGLHSSGSVQGPSIGSYKQHQPSDTIKKPLVSSLAEQISGSQVGLYSMQLVQDYATEASTL